MSCRSLKVLYGLVVYRLAPDLGTERRAFCLSHFFICPSQNPNPAQAHGMSCDFVAQNDSRGPDLLQAITNLGLKTGLIFFAPSRFPSCLWGMPNRIRGEEVPGRGRYGPSRFRRGNSFRFSSP